MTEIDDYWNVRKKFFKDGKLIPAENRQSVKEQKEMRKLKEQVQRRVKKISELQPYCPEGKKRRSKSDIKAVITERETGFAAQDYLVDYYEGKELVEKMHFRSTMDLMKYLHGVGGREFITKENDFNYDNVFFCKKRKWKKPYYRLKK